MRPRPTFVLGLCLVLTQAAPAAAQTVGVTAAVNQAARSIRPNTAIRTIALGDNVIHNERIETDTVGLLQILLADGTAFTVGPNSALAIDRFVYDPQAGTAQVAATLTKGVFRFIGGKTSKTPGGVSLGTPVGTIGIRGAVVDVSLAGSASGGAPTHVDMIFGDEVTLTAPDGQTNRIYEPGYSIVISANVDGAQTRSVQRTPPGFASAIQQSLAGAPGTSGGSPNRPSDGIVVASGVSAENSDRTPAINNPPIPLARPEPDRPRVVEATLIQDAQLDVGREQVIDDGGDGEERTVALRVQTAGETYETIGGRVVDDPGSVGLVGGSPEDDRIVTLTTSPTGTSGTGDSNRGTLVLPLYDDPQLVAHEISLADGASLGGVPLSGIAFSGEGGFAAYALALDGDPTRPVYGLKGTPLADDTVLRNGDVRRYAFTTDQLQDIPVPFMLAEALGADYGNAAITDFYVIEPSAGLDYDPRLFQAWLLIDGVGAQQKSGIGVSAGSIFSEDGALQIGYSRRGSYRANANATSFQDFGGITSYAAPGGGTQLFGSNGQYIVLGPDSVINDSFADSSADRSVRGKDFGTLHLLSLESEVPTGTFVAQNGGTRNLGTGDGLTGFASGLIEGVRADGSVILFPAVSGSDTGNVYISFNGEANRLGGEIDVGLYQGELESGARMHVAFGSGVLGNRGNGGSAYIDDDMFAARQNTNGETYDRTYLRDVDSSGETIQQYPQITGQNPGTYFVSGDAVKQPGLLPNGELCACKFLEWGWWGTQIRASDDPDTPDVEAIRAGVHLGNWVAGDVTSPAELATLAGTTASYAGHAVGTVTAGDIDSGTVARYIASGDMRMDWDFGLGSGSMAIDDFDGRDFSGTLGATGSDAAALFSGNLAQDNADASGVVHGAFVNDGSSVAAGVAGDFSLASSNANWSAVGILGGARIGE